MLIHYRQLLHSQKFQMSNPESSEPDQNVTRAQASADRLRDAAGKGDDAEETELWAGGYSGKAMYGTWATMALLTVIGIVVVVSVASLRENKWVWIGVLGLIAVLWIFSLSKIVIRKLSVWYELTSQRFKHRAGLLTRMTDRIELIDIDDVTFRQGPVQAMLGVGTIFIKSSDASHPELVLYGIDKVREVADMIDDARRKERRTRGLHIESV